jgi:formamidopyrimidine-DNA glycosylase
VPELPEVETVRASLEPVLVGRTFEQVAIDDGRLTRPFEPQAVAAELEGERVASVERRGKYLIVRFGSGRLLLVHLRMTGSFRHHPSGAPGGDPYVRAVVTLDDGSDVVYRDVRRFGTWLLLESSEADSYLAARLGAEPLARGFGPKALGTGLADRRAPLKAALLDQRTVAGLGNIYVDEALWRARLHPLRPARDLDEEELRALHRAIRSALRLGITRRGATLREFAGPDGRSGGMQEAFRVYGRAGEPCRRCGTPIDKIRVGGRGTWYCPRCQVLRRPAAAATRA